MDRKIPKEFEDDLKFLKTRGTKVYDYDYGWDKGDYVPHEPVQIKKTGRPGIIYFLSEETSYWKRRKV